MARPSYTICGGQADADRLARQAAVMAEATSAFLARAGLRPGWACLDVGCGDGQVTVQLARAVGLGGRAVGLDLDPDALAIARQAAQRAGVAASFVCADATTPVTRQTFDLAYARLLLRHLVEPSGCRWWLTAVSGTLTRTNEGRSNLCLRTDRPVRSTTVRGT